MAETLATHDNVEAVKYSDNSHHLHKVNAEGKRGKQIGSDEYLRQWGYDPNVRTSVNPEPISIPVVEAPSEAERNIHPAVAEGVATGRETSEAMNEQADAVVGRLDQILPGAEQAPITEAERKFQNGQRVKVITGGEQGEVVENDWEIVEATGRTSNNDILYEVRSPDGARTEKIAEAHLENMQLAPSSPEEEARLFDERINNRVATADRRMGIQPDEAVTNIITPPAEGEQATPPAADDAPQEIEGYPFGNHAERDRENPPGPHGELTWNDGERGPVRLRRVDGLWQVNRNGDTDPDWHSLSNDSVMNLLGLSTRTGEIPAAPAEQPAEVPAVPEEHPAETPPTPEELRIQALENRIASLEEAVRALTDQLAGRAPAGETPETPGEGEELVDEEEMNEALAELDAAMAAMDAGAADYAEARERLQRARQRVAGAWNGEQPPAGGGGENNAGGENGGNGNNEQGQTTVIAAAETDGGAPENPQQRRERMRRWGRRALGAALIAGGLVGAFFLGKHYGSHITEIVPGKKGGGEGTKKGVEHAAKFKTEQLSYYGDTIWAHGRATLAQAMGGKLPKDWQVYQWAKETMNLPGNKGHIMNSMGHWRSTWEGARHLPVGFHFRVSEAITRAIAKG